jgi:hypothetical protein
MKIFSRFFLSILSMTFSLFSLNADAQSLERRVIASGGTSVTTPLHLDYTIGETAVIPLTSSGIVVTQGFHQPFSIIPGDNIFPYLIIFPNPTAGDAEARFILSIPAKLTISIYNAVGQLMGSEIINYTTGEMQYIIKSRKLTPGVYIVQFAMNDGSGRISKQLVKLE